MKRLLTLLICCALPLIPLSSKADEGMWMLPYLKLQNYAKMKSLGLTLTPEQIYSPEGGALANAIVQFDGGCTGEVISPKGLILTNHHCGYNQIQAHSSVEKNLLRDGFFAPSLGDELPNPKLTITYTEKIIDVTEYVNEYIAKDNCSDPMIYLSRSYLQKIAQKWYQEIEGKEKEPWRELDLAPFYEGNRFVLFLRKVYSDIRLVAAPPSCIGKYGADTDNWVWPRHSGDFSLFRIYTAPDGSPATYSTQNIPLKTKEYLKVNISGVKEGEFVMIMGYPGRTNHFYTSSEVAERRDIDNTIRINMREARQQTLEKEMLADEAINIQYAAKYASSTNAYKNAIGSNWAIRKLDFENQRNQQQQRLIEYATKKGKLEYIEAIKTIEKIVKDRASLRSRLWYIDEGLLRSVEILRTPIISEEKFQDLTKDPKHLTNTVQRIYPGYYNKDYNREVDRKVAKRMLLEYLQHTKKEELPKALTALESNQESITKYVDKVFDTTIYRNAETLQESLAKISYLEYAQDPLVTLILDVKKMENHLKKETSEYNRSFALARKTFLKGILEMEGEMNVWPDANFTLRYTFGQVQGYSPRDNVFYGHQTTMEGVMEKEDPTNPEYILLPKVKEIYNNKDFGPYALKDGRMPVNFCATTHTTGGNSGSPVLDARGNLVGLNFDRNWEGVGGDIVYLPDYQRSIICDIRYTLMVLDKYLGAHRLIEEMKLVSKDLPKRQKAQKSSRTSRHKKK